MLPSQTYISDEAFREEWEQLVPKISCEELGQAHFLNHEGKWHMNSRVHPKLDTVIKTVQPYALKLTSSLELNGKNNGSRAIEISLGSLNV